MPVVRTDGRSVGRSVTWLPNFLGWVDFLSYGAPPTRALRKHVELRYDMIWYDMNEDLGRIVTGLPLAHPVIDSVPSVVNVEKRTLLIINTEGVACFLKNFVHLCGFFWNIGFSSYYATHAFWRSKIRIRVKKIRTKEFINFENFAHKFIS